MKESPVSSSAAGGTELHLFGYSAGEDGGEFGVEAFFTIEELPRVKHFDRYSTSGFRDSVSKPPQTVVFMGPLPCRGCDRCNAPKAVGASPD